jgi:hypothetical protein
MEKKFEKRLNFLSAYALASTLFIGLFALSSFKEREKKAMLDELTVKRINLLGEDGSLRMVMSNETRQHSGRMNGKDWPKRERPAGLIFFNEEGNECGGLIYKGKTKDGKTVSGMSITMDQYNEDQVLQILNSESLDNGKAFFERGISINEFPLGSNIDQRNAKLEDLKKIGDEKERKQKISEFYKNETSKNRLFIGKTKGNSSGLFLAGPDGQPKMMIYVDDKGVPKIETFDDKGNSKNYLDK